MNKWRPNPIVNTAARAKMKKWLEDQNNRAGMSAAGQTLLEGAYDDPYKALGQSVGAFFAARGQSRRYSEEQAKKEEQLGMEQERQAKKDAREEEDFSLRKQKLEADMATESEKRVRVEQQRGELAKLIPTLSREDQLMLGPLISDPDKFYSIYDDLNDNRRAKEQFDATFGEQQRHNKVSEAGTNRGYALEAERNQISREGQQIRAQGKNKLFNNGGMVSSVSPEGVILSTVQLPESPEEAKKAALKLILSGQYDKDSAMALLDDIDAKLAQRGGGPPPAAGAPGSDEEILAEIQQLRNNGLTDDDIMRGMADAPVMTKARFMKLMKGRR